MSHQTDTSSLEINESTIHLRSKGRVVKSRTASTLKQFWRYLKSAFSGNSEVRVWQCDRLGQTYWKIYDPLTGYRSTMSSEAEVRVWLEKRYSLPKSTSQNEYIGLI
jgi:hypothetical protein